MEAQNGDANATLPDAGGDQNDKKRPLAGEDEHDVKRLRTEPSEANDSGLQNGVSNTEDVGLNGEGESKTLETAIKPLSKGTAPVKQE